MVEGPRHFVAGQPLASEIFHSLGVECGAVAKRDAGNDVFGAVVTRTAHDCDVGDIRVCAHDFFHLVGVDVEASGDDDLFDSRRQADEPVFFHDRHIAGAEPVLVEGALIRFWFVEVAGKHLRAAGKKFSRLAIRHGLRRVVGVGDADFCVWKRQADVARAPVTVERVAGENGRSFGQAVAFNEPPAGGAFPFFDGGGGKRGRTRHRGVDR